jgi:hypothetical protein
MSKIPLLQFITIDKTCKTDSHSYKGITLQLIFIHI